MPATSIRTHRVSNGRALPSRKPRACGSIPRHFADTNPRADQSISQPLRSSELRIEHGLRALRELLRPRAVLPFFVGHPPRSLQILVENGTLALGEFGAEDVEIGFVVQAKRAVVEVGRTDARP